MDPAVFLTSFTGIVAIVMVFGIPIVTMIAAAIVILSLSRRKHLERMKMIEQGIMPPPPQHTRTGNYYALLVTGAVLLAFGLGLVVVEFATGGNDFDSLPFAFVGAALLVIWPVMKARSKRRAQADQPKPPEAPRTN